LLCVVASLKRRISFEIGDYFGKPILGEMRLCSRFIRKFSDRLLDTALSFQFYLDELVRATRIARVRRQELEQLEAPKRFYTPDVVYHYQMGVATDNPPLEYLSHYHVAEHYFEQVFNDDLIDRVQDRITRPVDLTRSGGSSENLMNRVLALARLTG
jgi:hypothetical protein